MDSSSWIDIGFSGFTGPTGQQGVTSFTGPSDYSDYFENYRKMLIKAMDIITENKSIEIRKENYNVAVQEKRQTERIERACGGID